LVEGKGRKTDLATFQKTSSNLRFLPVDLKYYSPKRMLAGK
jgi:hypothetical protein